MSLGGLHSHGSFWEGHFRGVDGAGGIRRPERPEMRSRRASEGLAMAITLLDRASALLERRISELEKKDRLEAISKGEAAAVGELVDLVEVSRKIEKDKADLMLKAIGLRAASLTPEQVAKLLESYEENPFALLSANGHPCEKDEGSS